MGLTYVFRNGYFSFVFSAPFFSFIFQWACIAYSSGLILPHALMGDVLSIGTIFWLGVWADTEKPELGQSYQSVCHNGFYIMRRMQRRSPFGQDFHIIHIHTEGPPRQHFTIPSRYEGPIPLTPSPSTQPWSPKKQCRCPHFLLTSSTVGQTKPAHLH